MPERYEIRGQNLPDGNKALSPKDIYNLNKNFSTIGLEVFGSADFVKTVKKEVGALEKKTDEIILSVEGKVGENEIVSAINLSPEEIKIQSSKISIEGLTTINENFKVLLDGSIEAVNAKLSGSITATRMVAPSNSSLYGEIGITGDNSVGLGLFDTRYGAEAFCEMLESEDRQGFLIRDRANRIRFAATNDRTVLGDLNGVMFLGSMGGQAVLNSPDTNTYVSVKNGAIKIVVNGITKASW